MAVLVVLSFSLSPAGNAGLKSLFLPGWGQFATGQKTMGWSFAGIEAVSWASYFGLRVRGDNLSEEYRVLAYEKAGASPSWGEEYWSAMERYYNYDAYIQGLWEEARRLFPDDPEDQAAYVDSVKLDGRWQWADTASHQEFMKKRSGARSAFNLSETSLGIILANHLFAGMEAFVYARFFQKTPLEGTGFRFRLLPGGGASLGFTRAF